ncbi:MAG: MBL fold metallo-hydrolase [Rhodospirillales bacterium]
MNFRVKFWGVRGSIACATPNHMKYGGNTSCIQITCGDQVLLFDAGTGVRPLGAHLIEGPVRDFHLFLTHTHWDHINGFPFFAPAYSPEFSIKIMAGHLNDKGGILQVLSTQMDNPMFPVPLEAMRANISYEDFEPGSTMDLGDGVIIRTTLLNHPNDATGYRVDYEGRSVAYITDTEHIPGKPDQNILGLIKDCDVVIYDSTYTDEEFPGRVGWGHSTWSEGMRLCQAAGAKRLAIFHHDPDHFDEFMDGLAETASKTWEGCFVTREGMEIDFADFGG